MSKHTPEQITFVADTLMPGFIPKDSTVSDLFFAFTLDAVNYEVVYQKNQKGEWKFISFKKA